MAKVQTTTEIPPETFTVSQGIYTEDLEAVVEMHNLSFGLGVAAGLAGQLSGYFDFSGFTNLGPAEVTFNTASGYSRRYRGQVWIDPDAANLELRSVVTMPAANTGRVRFTVGATTSVHNHAAASTTTTTSTLATSATGTGLVDFELELDHQTGSSDACILEDWYLQAQAVTSSLPSPVE